MNNGFVRYYQVFNVILFIFILGFYYLVIKIGDEKSVGIDVSVWVQVYGDKGDMGYVELKKLGMMDNLFE